MFNSIVCSETPGRGVSLEYNPNHIFILCLKSQYLQFNSEQVQTPRMWLLYCLPSYSEIFLWPPYSSRNRPECLDSQKCPPGDLCLEFSSTRVRCLLPYLLRESLWNPFHSEQHPWQLSLGQHWILLALCCFALDLSDSGSTNTSSSLTSNGASHCFMEKGWLGWLLFIGKSAPHILNPGFRNTFSN